MEIFNIVINCIESIILALFIYLVLQKRGKYISLFFVISIDCINTTLCNYFLVPELVLTLTTISIFFIYAHYLNRNSWIQNVFLVLCLDIMINASTSITILLTSCFFSFPSDSESVYIFMIICSKLLNFIIMIITAHYIKKWNILKTRKLIYLLLSIFLLDVAYSSLIDYIFIENIYNYYIVTLLVLINLLTLCLCIIFYETQKDQVEKLALQRDKLRLETQEKIYRINQNNIEELRKWKHDIKHVLLSASHFIKTNQIDQAISTLEQQNNILNQNQFFIQTGNDLLDSILIEKNQIISDKKIELILNINSHPCPINDTHFFVIIGNLLDNAIENCNSTQQKQIVISIGIYNKYYFIKMQNSIINPILKKNPLLITTKEDSSHHGIGIASIKLLVSQYHGKISFDDTNQLFTVNILIPLI